VSFFLNNQYILRRLGDYLSAIFDKVKSLIGISPNSPQFAKIAEEMRLNGQPQKAIQFCLEGLKVRPGYATAFYVLARCYIDENNQSKARDALVEALRFGPHHIAVLTELAALYHNEGNIPQTLNYYRQTLAIDPLNRRVRTIVESLAEKAGETDPLDSFEAIEEYDTSFPKPDESTSGGDQQVPLEPVTLDEENGKAFDIDNISMIDHNIEVDSTTSMFNLDQTIEPTTPALITEESLKESPVVATGSWIADIFQDVLPSEEQFKEVENKIVSYEDFTTRIFNHIFTIAPAQPVRKDNLTSDTVMVQADEGLEDQIDGQETVIDQIIDISERPILTLENIDPNVSTEPEEPDPAMALSMEIPDDSPELVELDQADAVPEDSISETDQALNISDPPILIPENTDPPVATASEETDQDLSFNPDLPADNLENNMVDVNLDKVDKTVFGGMETDSGPENSPSDDLTFRGDTDFEPASQPGEGVDEKVQTDTDDSIEDPVDSISIVPPGYWEQIDDESNADHPDGEASEHSKSRPAREEPIQSIDDVGLDIAEESEITQDSDRIDDKPDPSPEMAEDTDSSASEILDTVDMEEQVRSEIIVDEKMPIAPVEFLDQFFSGKRVEIFPDEDVELTLTPDISLSDNFSDGAQEQEQVDSNSELLQAPAIEGKVESEAALHTSSAIGASVQKEETVDQGEEEDSESKPLDKTQDDLLDPQADAIPTATLAELYVRQGLTDRAISVYLAMIEHDPTNPDIHKRLSELFVLKAEKDGP